MRAYRYVLFSLLPVIWYGQVWAISDFGGGLDARRVVALQLVLDDGEEIKARTVEGTPLYVERGDVRINLRPFIQPGSMDRVELQILDLGEDAAGGLLENLVTSIVVPVGEAQFVALEDMTMRVKLVDVQTVLQAPLQSLDTQEPLASRQCCITCGGVRACGCSVEMSCGSCCAFICCNFP